MSYNPDDPTPKWIQEVGGHECPKHGRYYGICHSCANAQREKDRRDTLTSLMAERNALRDEIDRLKSDLEAARNFLRAFDTYFEMRGGHMPSPQKVDDAKQAMFSAAMQARKALEETGK